MALLRLYVVLLRAPAAGDFGAAAGAATGTLLLGAVVLEEGLLLGGENVTPSAMVLPVSGTAQIFVTLVAVVAFVSNMEPLSIQGLST